MEHSLPDTFHLKAALQYRFHLCYNVLVKFFVTPQRILVCYAVALSVVNKWEFWLRSLYSVMIYPPLLFGELNIILVESNPKSVD